MKKLCFYDPSVTADVTFKGLPGGRLLAKVGETNFHYLLEPGYVSGEADLHRSNESFPEGHPSRHERLGAIPRRSLVESLKAVSPRFMNEFVRLWRSVSLESVIRQGLIVGARIPAEGELNGVKKVSIKRGPARCTEPMATLIKPPEFYEDVLRPPFAAYLLFKRERQSFSPFAVMFPYCGRRGRTRLRWAKIRDIKRWQSKWETILWRDLQGLLAS
jgi:hypothetical protein